MCHPGYFVLVFCPSSHQTLEMSLVCVTMISKLTTDVSK